MSSLFDNCGHSRKSKCEGCVCDQLKKLINGDMVDIIIRGEDYTDLKFILLDEKTCCATFLDSSYPFIIDCKKIDAIRIVS